MNDRPDAHELLEAVKRFLEDDVMPVAQGPHKYQARVAAHVLGIVAREWRDGDGDLREEWQRLAGLNALEGEPPGTREALTSAVREQTERLVERIRAGEADADPFRAEVLAHLRQTCEAKLRVARG